MFTCHICKEATYSLVKSVGFCSHIAVNLGENVYIADHISIYKNKLKVVMPRDKYISSFTEDISICKVIHVFYDSTGSFRKNDVSSNTHSKLKTDEVYVRFSKPNSHVKLPLVSKD